MFLRMHLISPPKFRILVLFLIPKNQAERVFDTNLSGVAPKQDPEGCTPDGTASLHVLFQLFYQILTSALALCLQFVYDQMESTVWKQLINYQFSQDLSYILFMIGLEN